MLHKNLTFVVVTILLAVAAVFACNAAGLVSAMGNREAAYNLPYRIGGGDCSANNTTGDLYTPVDPYCQTNLGDQAQKISSTEDISKDLTENEVIFTPIPTEIVENIPTQIPTEVIEVVPTVIVENPTQIPTENPPAQPTEKKDKNNPNKGEGNGSEGSDPGNHPENGNDDEDGGKKPKK